MPGLDLYNALKAGNLNYKHFLNIFWIYPPLVPFSYTLFYLIFGTGTEMELMVNSFYLSVMLLSIYGIGRRMFNEKIGLLSAFILSSFPSVIAVSRLVYAEFHLMCLTVLSIYLLLRTDYFTNRKYSIALGISLALVALAKWEFPPMLIGPFAVILYRARIIDTHIPYRTKLSNFFLSLFIGFLLSGFWYVPNFRNVIFRLFFWEMENVFNNNRTFPFTALFEPGNLLYYILSLNNSHIGFIYFVIFVISLPLLILNIFKKTERKRDFLFLISAWIVFPYIAFTFVKIKGYSHMFSILPPIALTLAITLDKAKGIFKNLTLLLLIALGLNLYLHSFFRFNVIDAISHIKIFYDSNRPKFNLCLYSHDLDNSWPHKGFKKPDASDWHIKQILEFIEKDSNYLEKDSITLIIADSIDFNHSKFLYFALSGHSSYILPMAYSEKAPKANLPINYMVVKSKKRFITASEIRRIIDFNSDLWGIREEMLEKGLLSLNDYFLLKYYTLPDGSRAAIFKLTDSAKDV